MINAKDKREKLIRIFRESTSISIVEINLIKNLKALDKKQKIR